MTGTFVANGSTIRIDHFAGTTPNAGSISATGEVRLDPAAGFPGSIRLTGQHAQLVANDILSATADMALDISGPLAQKPRVDGRITIVGMDISVPSRFNSVAAPLPGTKHLNPTATARARLALVAKAKGSGARAPLFDATLALTISAMNRIFVRGRGIYAELGGNLHVNGSARDPQVTGGFELLRGSLMLLSSRLTFTRGDVRFHGDVMPDLDLVAETSTGGVTAQIAVTGPAVQPAFQISSNPSLPDDEILSRILFQKSSGSLSAFQALQLANAVGDSIWPSRRVRECAKVAWRRQPGHQLERDGWGARQRDPRDQRPGERRRDDRSEASGQRSELEFRCQPPCQAAGGRRLQRRVERRRRPRLGVQVGAPLAPTRQGAK